MRAVGVLSALCALLLLSACGRNAAAISECVDRGIVYFNEIGSYPRLSDGRSASSVARERCERSSSAFP